MEMLKKYWMYIAGAVVLIMMMRKKTTRKRRTGRVSKRQYAKIARSVRMRMPMRRRRY